eukprot:1798927-Pyramimonas_sp.AAC.2
MMSCENAPRCFATVPCEVRNPHYSFVLLHSSSEMLERGRKYTTYKANRQRSQTGGTPRRQSLLNTWEALR